MSDFDKNTAISNLRITIGKAKAVAEMFCREYVEPDGVEDRVLAVRAGPETQVFLFCALQDLLHEAEQTAITLEAT